MHLQRRFLALCGLLGLTMSISCAPPPAAPPRSIPPSPPAVAQAEPCPDEPAAAEELVRKGQQIEGSDLEQALTLYQQAEALAPKSPRIQYRIGMVYQKKDDWDKSAAALGRAVTLDPSFANYWFRYGYSLQKIAKRERKGWENARKAYEKCIEIDENYSDCHHGLGDVYQFTDEERKALEYYTKAIQIDPTQIRYYAPLADLYINLDFVNEAEMVLKQAKQLARPMDPPLFWVHVLMSQIHQIRGATADSVLEMEAAKVVAADKGSEAVMILFMLGSTYAILNPPRRAEAIANLKGFAQRACKEPMYSRFVTECTHTQTLISKLGGTRP